MSDELTNDFEITIRLWMTVDQLARYNDAEEIIEKEAKFLDNWLRDGRDPSERTKEELEECRAHMARAELAWRVQTEIQTKMIDKN